MFLNFLIKTIVSSVLIFENIYCNASLFSLNSNNSVILEIKLSSSEKLSLNNSSRNKIHLLNETLTAILFFPKRKSCPFLGNLYLPKISFISTLGINNLTNNSIYFKQKLTLTQLKSA